MPQAQFSAEQVQAVIREKLRSLQRYSLVKLVLAAERQDILNLRKGKAMADFSYRLWSEVLSERTVHRRPLAVALKINGNLGFRFRDETGASGENVLCGENPFVIDSDKGRAKILHVNFSRIPRDHSSVVYISFFVEAPSPVSMADAKTYARGLKSKVQLKARILTIVRSDSWFIENEGFPVFYPFGRASTPPTLTSYICSPTIVCADTGNQFDCHAQEYRFGRCNSAIKCDGY